MADGSEGQAVRLAASVLEEMPAEVPLPEPWVAHAGQGQLLDGAGAHWFVEPDGMGVRRLVWLKCECAHYEVTWYMGGVEISRVVGVVA
ncbi:hypothetical protein ACIP93_29665 [Streptomyces sp. NPDC088745]|uniref:hypothetical protein n=1 Tax=Streptomyces sp. NPDC088745 TaxID=3365884 RepID=UPI00381A5D62